MAGVALGALSELTLAQGTFASEGRRAIFVDTDTASDDAVALMIAFAEPGIEIAGICTVAGNVPVDVATRNAIYVRGLCGAKAPIHRGAASPLIRPLQTAQFIHGRDGMGDIGLPIRDIAPDSTDAVGALIAAAKEYSGNLELVTLGPLTNVAVAVRRAPEIVPLIKRCVVMGGVSDYRGNVTPVSEFNFWVDPEAAAITLQSGLAIEMVGWDISRKYAVFDDADAAAIREIGTERARVAIDCQKKLREFSLKETGLRGFDLPDPIAMAVALRPEIATQRKKLAATIITNDGPTRGMVMFDELSREPKGSPIGVVKEASREAFVAMLRDAMRAGDSKA